MLYFIGNVYIAAYGNHRIRKVTVSTGIISTIAGTGTSSYSGDGGVATSASLYYPRGVAVDASGRIVTIMIFCCIICYKGSSALTNILLLITIN